MANQVQCILQKLHLSQSKFELKLGQNTSKKSGHFRITAFIDYSGHWVEKKYRSSTLNHYPFDSIEPQKGKVKKEKA